MNVKIHENRKYQLNTSYEWIEKKNLWITILEKTFIYD